MKRRERLTRDGRYSTGAMVFALVFSLGIVALLAVQALFDGEKAAASAPPAVAQSSYQVSPYGRHWSAQAAYAAAVAAKQDDPLIPSF